MNWWSWFGIALSAFVIYESWRDAQQLRTDPDRFLLDTLHGEGSRFYLTLLTSLNRVTRTAVHELTAIDDPERRQALLDARVLAMPNRGRILDRLQWEIRFRLVAFVLFAVFLLYDLITTGGSISL